MYPTQRQSGEQGQGHYQSHPSSSPPQHPAHPQPYGMPPPRQSLPPVDALQQNRPQPPPPPMHHPHGPPARPANAYYDPTMDARHAQHVQGPPHPAPRSPGQPMHQMHPQRPDLNGHNPQTPYQNGAPPPSYHHQAPHPPIPSPYSNNLPPALTSPSKNAAPTPAPPRNSNPMSMSNLLADSGPPPQTVHQPPPPAPPAAVQMKDARPQEPQQQPQLSTVQRNVASPVAKQPAPHAAKASPEQPRPELNGKPRQQPHPPAPPAFPLPPATGPPDLTVRGTEAAYAEIEARDHSDVEGPGFEVPFEDWKRRTQKRTLELEHSEAIRRKRRREHFLVKYAEAWNNAADNAKEIYIAANEGDAEEEVKTKDVELEKERKKDMQRKRRRERTLQNETAKRDEAIERLQHLDDEEERMKIMKDVQRAGKKIKNTEDLLSGKIPSRDYNDDSADSMDDSRISPSRDDEAAKTKRSVKSRPRKSKDQKLAEKENALSGQMYLDRGDDLASIYGDDEGRFSYSGAKSDAPPYTSKGYNQIYEQIWKDLAKNHVNKVFRIRNSSLDVKQSNLRKTAQLAAKEARRWQIRTNKSTKDVQARAKRSMREMLSFWKRNERDERDQRKLAEKAELESARKAEADREAARQKRKLNFLISQTELYSHFIGKKVKTDELERSTDDTAQAAADKIRDGPQNAHTITLPDSNANLSAKVTNFEDLDFDAEDETALQAAAMANAQNAIKEAQDRARAFNSDGQAQEDFDDGEMNFQNPSSLQSMDVAQPKMLTCQLKEYQLKGLNWLVNLYEQGINGILADEMGLGKTVQSISVMSYLAENHNIWGPFLVIAPASTLHNWQQEITKFVPTLKVLPYWGNAKDRKVLRKFWDRKHITYTRDSPFHVLVTSYQLVVQDTAYFQKIKWQYMILDEAQAIKSSSSSRWKALLGFHCRNRLLLTGTPIQNNMQELWALLHFIMPSLFDSHDEFSEWFSKDIESHAQSNTKLNEDQLRRLHMILKPFMLRRVKKHVQKELGDKVELDVFCDLTYRQRAYYTSLRNKISFMDLIEKAAVGDDQDTATLMNLVMQFRKVCNHPDLFERADITSPLSMSTWAETASFMREGFNINVAYSVKNSVEYWLPKMLISGEGRLDLAGPDNLHAGWRNRYLNHLMSVYDPEHVQKSSTTDGAFSWLRFVDTSAGEIAKVTNSTLAERCVSLAANQKPVLEVIDEAGEKTFNHAHKMLEIIKPHYRQPLTDISEDNHLQNLLNISRFSSEQTGYDVIEKCFIPKATAPPIELVCPGQESLLEKDNAFYNVPLRRALYPISPVTEMELLRANVPPSHYPVTNMLPKPDSEKQRYTRIQVPSMRRFVSDCGKLAKLDELLRELKAGGHRVLLYFQMTRMIDLMEEYLTYRNYKFCRLDGSTKLEDRRDTVAAFQGSDEIFVFLLSTRAGGLGINLVAADTVIFYDSDWNPTIDSQAMDRAHRLGQTRQVTVYRLITRGTIEERIRKRALQKEEVQRVVISGGGAASSGVDFAAKKGDNRTKDIALWLADDDEAAEIEKREAELAEQEARDPTKKRKRGGAAGGRKKELSMDDMYHEGEGRFDDDTSNKPSGAATPIGAAADDGPPVKKKRISKKAKTMQQRLAVADGQVDGGF